ncbi:MAG TPA: CbiX/SirB N-terminal domain-containing protein, partial [Mycobacterium sp.]|nr:CbiX/SirB N-terminal domain-containing protein [Mycobacterium sp.]
MSYLLVAHGTRKPHGVAMIGQLAQRVSALLARPVHVAFVDVLGPTPEEVLRALPSERPVTVVPAFLASGYHVRVDLPAHVAASGHPAVTVTAPLGPCAGTVQVLSQRLVECGWRPGDSVVMAAAGTSDVGAQSDLRITAATLSATIGDRVELAYAATGAPRVDDAVSALRAGGA